MFMNCNSAEEHEELYMSHIRILSGKKGGRRGAKECN